MSDNAEFSMPAEIFDSVLWIVEPKPEHLTGDELYPTHSGTLKLAEGITLKVYRLNDGQNVIDAEDVHKIFQPRFTPGMVLIQQGKCPIGATNQIACWPCQFGHATECHHPHDCQTAQCSHLEKYQ